jgi:hypothetical protein
MSVDRVIDRSFLRFPEEVKERFAFLKALGFCDVLVEVSLVRYEAPTMGINVFHGRRSYEIGLEIESMQVPIESYSISEILRLVDIKGAENYRNFMAHTVEGVAEGVHRLAILLRECIDAGIFSDKQFFPRLKLQQDTLTKDYWFKMEFKQARHESESAWAKKDFGKVVQILSPLQEHLNPSDLKKLEYAKKHL